MSTDATAGETIAAIGATPNSGGPLRSSANRFTGSMLELTFGRLG